MKNITKNTAKFFLLTLLIIFLITISNAYADLNGALSNVNNDATIVQKWLPLFGKIVLAMVMVGQLIWCVIQRRIEWYHFLNLGICGVLMAASGTIIDSL